MLFYLCTFFICEASTSINSLSVHTSHLSTTHTYSCITKHAHSQGYQFSGPIQISLESSDALSIGLLAVSSESVTGSVTWAGVLDVNGQRHVLRRGRTVLGRGTDADITVNDSSISRKHVEIIWDGSRAQANDLGSTNGSLLMRKHKVQVWLINTGWSGGSIEMGASRVTFHLVPQAAGHS